MLKKLTLLLACGMLLTACPAPNASENGQGTATTGDGNFSKEAYIRLLTCTKEKMPEQAAAMDQAIAAANQLPDSAFENADSPIFATWAKQAEAAGCGS